MEADILVQGFCHEKFSPVREAFEANFQRGAEVGASFAATVEGEPVVDLWGGFADRAQTRPWERDTLVNVWSTTKAMTVTCIHMLIDRGLLDLDTPVSAYWPEFGQAGKENIPIRYILSHQSGVAAITQPALPTEALYDWELMTSAIAAQEPLWEPGSKHGYHSMTLGYIAGELVRRVTGKSIGTYFKDEIAMPLGVDFHIGLPETYESRVAEIIPPTIRMSSPTGTSAGSDLPRQPAIRTNNPPTSPTLPNRREWRAAEIPAANGHGNARSLARVMSALALGGAVDGVRLMSPDTLEKAIEEQAYGPDLVLGKTMRWGLGYILNSPESGWNVPSPRAFGHAGWGGSIAIADLDARVSWAYAMNKMSNAMTGDDRAGGLIRAFYESL